MYKNLTMQDFFKTFPTARIELFFLEGLETQNGTEAFSALGELRRRRDYKGITTCIDTAFTKGWLMCGMSEQEDVFIVTLANALSNFGRDEDKILREYGLALRRCVESGAGVSDGPTVWWEKYQYYHVDKRSEAEVLLDDLQLEQSEMR